MNNEKKCFIGDCRINFTFLAGIKFPPIRDGDIGIGIVSSFVRLASDSQSANTRREIASDDLIFANPATSAQQTFTRTTMLNK